MKKRSSIPMRFTGKFFVDNERQSNALFAPRLCTLETKSQGKKIEGIRIYLDSGTLMRKAMDLVGYKGKALCIHGVQADVSIANLTKDTAIAFGCHDSKEPTASAQLGFFKNWEIIMQNLQELL